jgi:ABC-type arginine transport system permease subunit
VAARAVRQPFTFYFGAIMIYLAITVVSIYAFRHAEVWSNRGIRRA